MSEAIIEAYDKALNELIWLQTGMENALATVRNALIKARREALQKELKKHE